MHDSPTFDGDIFSDAHLSDPYENYRLLRERGPVVHLEQHDVWAIPRYDDVRGALENWEAFSSTGIAFNEPLNQAMAGVALATDPPRHDEVRAVMSHNLAPRALRGLRGSITTKAEKLVADMIDRGSFDAVSDFAEILPVSVVLELIGLPESLQKTAEGWAGSGFDAFGPPNDRTDAALTDSIGQITFMAQLRAEDLIEGTFGRAAFEAAERGEITNLEAAQIVLSYFSAGLDTTVAVLGNAIMLFAQHPDQWDLVRSDPSRIPGALEELVRLETPIQLFGRRATRDVEVDGVVVPAGASVAVLYGSANRDDRHFAAPETLDVTRDLNDHLGFGFGVHTCAGQGLARMEITAALTALAARVQRFHIGEPLHRLGNVTRQLRSLPVLELETV
jgi:cytochrome P450